MAGPNDSGPISTPEELDDLSDAPVLAQIRPALVRVLQELPGTAALYQPPADPDGSLAISLLSGADQQQLDDLAVLLTGQAVAEIASSGFAAAVQGDLIDKQLATLEDSGIVDRVTTAIYAVKFLRQFASVLPGLGLSLTQPGVAGPLPGSGPAQGLAGAFARYVSTSGYVAQKRMELSTVPPNGVHDVELITFKLKALNTAAHQQVAALYQSAGLPVFDSLWTDLTSVALAAADLFPLVQAASEKVSNSFSPLYGGDDFGPQQSMETITVGPNVADFIRNQLAPRGLTTGQQQPTNTTFQEV